MANSKKTAILDKLKSIWNKSGAKKSFDQKSAKSKGKIVKIVSVALFLLIVILLVNGRESRKINTAAIKNSKPAEVDLLDKRLLESTWYARATKEFKQLEEKFKKLEAQVSAQPREIREERKEFQEQWRKSMQLMSRESERIKDELANIERQKEQGEIDPKDADKKIESLIRKREELIKSELEQQEKAKNEPLQVKQGYPKPAKSAMTPSGSKAGYPPSPPAGSSKNAPVSQQPGANNANGNQGAAAGYGNLIHVDIEVSTDLLNSGRPKSDRSSKPEPLPIESLIPVGSFFNVTLLHGIDAATGLKAQGQPHPLLLKINGRSQLPNRFKQDVSQCHIVSEAFGSLSDEKAYIRTTTLSCLKKNGDVINSPIQGVVVGEDGSLGLRGRVVSRKGAFLARRIIASFLDGMASAFSASSTTIDNYLGGTTTTVDPDDAFSKGFGDGISKAMEDLSESFEKMADEIFPVIEIASGRKGHVVVTDEVSLKPTKRMDM